MEFTEVYKAFSDKIYRVCLGFVNDSDKAKDLTQETFITVLQNLDLFRKESKISTWIYRIATNKCLREIENDKRVRKADFPSDIEQKIIENDQKEEKLMFLSNCVAELPEIDRIIITLFMEDMPQEEIGEVTGLTHANVRVKVHRIKERLFKKFKEHGKL